MSKGWDGLLGTSLIGEAVGHLLLLGIDPGLLSGCGGIGFLFVGVELGLPDGLAPLLARMDESPLQCERLHPGTPAYRYLT